MIGSTEILVGDVREQLQRLEADSFHAAITSPPYFQLRDYGVPGQIGLEDSPEAFVETLVDVFREVRRVLRPDGTLWVNIGDTYGTKRNGETERSLVQIPARFALAMTADGWLLRSEIVWAKGVSFCPTYSGNASPEPLVGVRYEREDGRETLRRGSWRPTAAWERVYLFAASRDYYADGDPIRETDSGRPSRNLERTRRGLGDRGSNVPSVPGSGRNVRNVWTITPRGFPNEHFATFPEKLIDPIVRCATSEFGVCSVCSAPIARVVEMTDEYRAVLESEGAWTSDSGKPDGAGGFVNRHDANHPNEVPLRHRTVGARPTCDCERSLQVVGDPSRILDPFAGAGTTLLVAAQLGRDAVGVEINPDYATMARRRIGRALRPGTYRDADQVDDAPLFQGVAR